ncbi:sulfate adenylyltransferase [Paracoccus thiocyanatus]|uniref:Sulfate adenylyltransferase n=1 Tax=Paracoccus thiocyanatus TaxID=34006 RepID=A0A1N6RTR8_9RHOB|nr:transcription antiterminator BlgG [Paracoccus thiocyanatus]SIQ32260.1 sulfate adenylyltransferase [Paracoccus thiocyanatus]
MTLPHHQPIPALLVSPDAAQKLRAEAGRLPGWVLTDWQLADLVLLLGGGLFPLRGFLPQADCDSVQARMRLGSGALWPLPLALEVGEDFARTVEPGDDIALCGPDGAPLAILSVTDKWRPAAGAGGTDDPHPGLRKAAPVCLGGPVKGLALPERSGRSPNDWRAQFRAQDSRRVLGCHPVDEDLARPLAARMGAELLVVARPLRPAGPRETILQALVHRNHGATHLLLPADPAARALLLQYRDEIGLDLIERQDATP